MCELLKFGESLLLGYITRQFAKLLALKALRLREDHELRRTTVFKRSRL